MAVDVILKKDQGAIRQIITAIYLRRRLHRFNSGDIVRREKKIDLER